MRVGYRIVVERRMGPPSPGRACDACYRAIGGDHWRLRPARRWDALLSRPFSPTLARVCDERCLDDWLLLTNCGARPYLLPDRFVLAPVPGRPTEYAVAARCKR